MLVYLSAFLLCGTSLCYLWNTLQKCNVDLCEDFPIARCLFSIFISLVIAKLGLKRKSLDWSGALAGILVGFIHTFSSLCFFACLLTFFLTSSQATKFKSEKKKKLEAEFKEGGQRNWHQVLCNGAASSQFALLYLLNGGPEEISIDFEKSYLRSWLAVAVLSALAGANGDTWASELGTGLAKEDPLLITSLERVPVGTNGGFTMVGLWSSALGGATVGLSYFVALFLWKGNIPLQHGFFLLLIGTAAGFFGSLLDSFIGATLQYSGLDPETGKVVENPGRGIKHISGRPFFNNHSVNMIMIFMISVMVPTVTGQMYKYFR